MKFKSLIAVGACALALSACATITRGTQEAFVIDTDPPGANAELSLGMHCTTPCTLRLSREAEFTVTITKPGYETVRANVTHTTAGAGAAGMAGNVLVGGIIGGVIDANSGATQNLTPNPLSVNLVREDEAMSGTNFDQNNAGSLTSGDEWSDGTGM